MHTDQETLQRFAGALESALTHFDWESVGNEYCHTGGEHFFDADAIENIRDVGLLFASDLGERLTSSQTKQSLYVGIGIAELIPILFETIILQRKVTAVTLPGLEPDQLNRALQHAERASQYNLPRVQTKPLKIAEAPSCDHLWFASVVNDPDAFPALHDDLYGRRGTKEATGKGHLEKERKRALHLMQSAFSWLEYPGWLTTSQEELPLWEKLLGPTYSQFQVPLKARLSAIVGDPVLHCHWSPA